MKKSQNKTSSATRTPTPWLVYLLECEDGTLYTGITNDLYRRFAEHCAGVGARYTRSHPPAGVLAVLVATDRSDALRIEAAVKALPKTEKLARFVALGAETG